LEWQKYITYFIIIQTLILLAFSGFEIVAVLLICVTVLAVVEFIQILIRNNIRIIRYTILFGILISAGFGHIFLWKRQNVSGAFAFVLIITASTDSFAQLWGRAFGKHKLCPGLSPNKTVEGLIGGFLSTLAVACLFRFLMPGFDIWQISIISTLLTTAAVAGDLIFSFIKRRLRIKDFSDLLPGHGGIMDRFDSLVLALPVFYWFGRFLKV
jgi:phosphatidate cytidylyltransferase